MKAMPTAMPITTSRNRWTKTVQIGSVRPGSSYVIARVASIQATRSESL
jgi:hypothetical protein